MRVALGLRGLASGAALVVAVSPAGPAQALDESTLQTPLARQQPPAPEGGVKVTMSFGR